VADYPTYKFVTHFLSPRGEKAIEYQLTTLTEIMSKRKIKQAWGEGEEEGMMIFFHTPKNKQTNKQKQKIKRNKKKRAEKEEKIISLLLLLLPLLRLLFLVFESANVHLKSHTEKEGKKL